MNYLVFDGNQAICRAKHTTGHLQHGMIYGVIRIAKAVTDKFKPDKVIFVFDRGIPEKTKYNSSYKSNRNFVVEHDSDMARLEAIFEALGIETLTKDNVEADDVIGIITGNFIKDTFTIVSTDKDFYQIIEKDRVVIYNPITEQTINETLFRSLYSGLPPHKMVELKCIMGDVSDNIQGVEGVGEKGAIQALMLLENGIIDLPSPKLTGRLSKINDSVELVLNNYRIIRIKRSLSETDIPFESICFSNSSLKPNEGKIKEFFDAFGFRKLNPQDYVKTFSFGN